MFTPALPLIDALSITAFERALWVTYGAAHVDKLPGWVVSILKREGDIVIVDPERESDCYLVRK